MSDLDLICPRLSGWKFKRSRALLGALSMIICPLSHFQCDAADPLIVSAETAIISLDTRVGAPTARITAIALTSEYSLDTRPLIFGSLQSFAAAVTPDFALTTECVPQPEGLISWLRGEGNTLDSAGGLNSQSAQSLAYVAGKVGQGFNLQNGYVRVANDPLLQPQRFTVAAWARSGSSAQYQYILNKSFNGDGGSYAIATTSGGRAHFYVYTSGGWRYATSGALTWNNQWHHFAGTYDGAALRFYIDGAQVAETPMTLSITYASTYLGGDLMIGTAYQNPGITRWLGAIDEVIVANRALDPTEIAAIYDAGEYGFCLPPVIQQSPLSQRVAEGATVQFQVAASSDEPMIYQWQFNGVDIEGATGSTLAIQSATLAHEGQYRVIVSNSNGSVTSEVATLGVDVCVPPPAGLSAWWRGEGNIIESVAALPAEAAGVITYSPGKVGQAFSTRNGYFRVADHQRLRPVNLTVAVWLQGPPLSGQEYVLSKSNHNAWHSYALHASGSAVSFNIGTAATFHTVTAPIVWDRWHHIAATYDGATLRLLVDGVSAASLEVNSPIQYGTQDHEGSLLIGSDFAGYSWLGGIDELMIFNRALSADEINAISSAQTAGVCPPPVIVQQPVSQTAREGGNASFEVSASSRLALRYQWQFEGEDLPGQNTSTLVLANVSAAQAGMYRVVVSNDSGSVTSDPVRLELCLPAPANLRAWWRGDGNTADSIRGLSGQAQASLGYFTGDDRHAFDGSAGFVRVPDHRHLRPTQFTIAAWVKTANSGPAQYIISKSFENPPASSSSYALATGLSGEMRFFVTVGGYRSVSANISWDDRWRHLAGTYDGTAIRLYVDGVLSASLPVAGPVEYGTGNSNGDLLIGAGYTSGEMYRWPGLIDEVLLLDRALSSTEIANIHATGSAGICPTPTITQEPESRIVNVGAPVEFRVVAASTLPLRYQWQFNGVNIPGQTEPRLAFDSAARADAGTYRVIVSDDSGSVSADAGLVVDECVAAPSGLVSWWHGDGNTTESIGNLVSQPVGSLLYVSGENRHAFSTGNGFVRVADDPTLRPAQLTVAAWVKGPLTGSGSQYVLSKSFENPPGPSSSYALATDPSGQMRFFIAAGGYQPISTPVTWDDRWRFLAGTYDGTTLRLYLDGVLAASRAISAPIEFSSAQSNGDLLIGAGYTTGNLYPWLGLIDEVMIFNRALTPAEIAAIYTAGSAGFCLTPIIIAQPISQRVIEGSNVTFEITSSPATGITYQWQFNETDIPGETARTLVIPNVRSLHAGRYRAVVSNQFGTVLSNPAELIVDVCAPAPPGLEAWWPGNGSLLNMVGETQGELRNGVSFTAGRVGQAFNFDGIDDEISLGEETGQFYTDDATIAFWVRGAFARSEPILTKRTAAGPVSSGFSIFSTENRIYLTMWETAPGGGGWGGTVFFARQFTDNAWHHIAFARTHSGGLKGYIDGQLELSDQSSNWAVNLNSDADFLIGGDGAGGHFTGAIDELMLFRHALDAPDVAAIYASGAAGLCPVPTAPAVARPVGPAEVNAGGAWTLSAVTDGVGPFTFQWRRNGEVIPGATGPTLSIPNVTANDAGDYYVIVTSPHGYRASQAVRLGVALPPTIVEHPASQSVRPAANERIRLEVRATGTGPFTYQWLRNDVAINGATDARLEILQPGPQHAGLYRARVTNAAGSATSDPATVTILLPLRVTTPPASVQTGEGQRVELSVAVAGDGPFEYQWRLNGRNIPNANSSTYLIESMTLADAGQYTVAITDPAGAITSDPANVTLVSVGQFDPADAFANALPIEGNQGTLRTSNATATREPFEPEHAGESGQRSIWFTWVAPANGRLALSTVGSSFDTLLAVYLGVALDDLDPIAGSDDDGGFATSSTFANVHAGQRCFIAVDGLGDASGSVLLSWNFAPDAPLAPRILEQPQSITTTLGETVRLTIAAENAQSFQWRRNGADVPGATSAEIVLPSLQRSELGLYDVVVTGGGVEVTSQTVEVQAGSDSAAIAFDKLFDRLVLLANPPPPPRGPPIARSGFGSIASARGFVGIPGLHETSTIGGSRDPGEPNHAGEAGGASTWFVIIADGAGVMEVTTDGSLMPNGQSLDTVLAIYSGDEVVLDFVQLTLLGADNNGGADGRASRVTIPVQAGAYYYCAVDGVGGAQGNVRINYRIGSPPVIQDHPASRNVLIRGAAAFSVRASNAPLASNYQWYHNDAAIPGAIGESLAIPDVQAAHAGQYTCRVSTFAGSVRSLPATLTVLAAQPLRMARPTLVGNRARLRIQGGSALPLRLESSSNLINWTPVQIQVPSDTYLDLEVSNQPGGVLFYRIAQ